MSLLDEAKKLRLDRAPSKIGPDEIELAVAWACDEIGIGQAERAVGKNPGGLYVFLARALRQAVRTGQLARTALPTDNSNSPDTSQEKTSGN